MYVAYADTYQTSEATNKASYNFDINNNPQFQLLTVVSSWIHLMEPSV